MSLLCRLGIHRWEYREERVDFITLVRIFVYAHCSRGCERYGEEQIVHVDTMVRSK